MTYRTVGRTGVKVSSLCFGTMSFGDSADPAESARMFRRCLDTSINFFDTADVYAGGRSEEILGALMAPMRDDLVVTSKVFGRTGKDVNAGGLSRRHVTRAVEASLRRLNTDRLEPSLAAATFSMTPTMRDEVTALSPAVAPAHDRSEEL